MRYKRCVTRCLSGRYDDDVAVQCPLTFLWSINPQLIYSPRIVTRIFLLAVTIITVPWQLKIMCVSYHFDIEIRYH
jgi:hypothetical protein